jgi:hypothetical protein
MSSNNVNEFLSLFLNYFVEIFSDLFYNGNLINSRDKFIKISYDSKQIVFRHFMYELLKTDDPSDDKARLELILLLNFLDYYGATENVKKDTSLIRNKPKLSKFILPMILYHNTLHIYINNDYSNSFLGTFNNNYFNLYREQITQFYSDTDNYRDLLFFRKYLKIEPLITTTSISKTPSVISNVSPTESSGSSVISSVVPSVLTSGLSVSTSKTPTSILTPSNIQSSKPTTTILTPSNIQSSKTPTLSSTTSNSSSSTSSSGSSLSSITSDPLQYFDNFQPIESNIIELLRLNFTNYVNTIGFKTKATRPSFDFESIIKKRNPLIESKTIIEPIKNLENTQMSFFGKTLDINNFDPLNSSTWSRKELTSIKIGKTDGYNSSNPINFEMSNIDNFIQNISPPLHWEEQINMEYMSFLTIEQIHQIQNVIVQKMKLFLNSIDVDSVQEAYIIPILQSYKEEISNVRGEDEIKLIIKTVMQIYSIIFIDFQTLKGNINTFEINYHVLTEGAKKSAKENGFVFNVFLPFFTTLLRNEYIDEFLLPYLQSSCSPYCVFQNLGSNEVTSDIDITILNTRGYLMKLMAQKITDVIFQPLFDMIYNVEDFTFNVRRPGGKTRNGVTVKLSSNLSNLFDVNIYCSGWYNFCFSDITTYPYITPMDQCYKYDEFIFDSYRYFFYSQLNFAFIRNFKFFGEHVNGKRVRLPGDVDFGEFLPINKDDLVTFRKNFNEQFENYFVVAESLYIKLKNLEDNNEEKFDHLQLLILLMEQCLRRYQSVMAKITKKLLSYMKNKQSISLPNGDTTEVNEDVIIQVQKMIEKRFLYEYLTLKSLEQCYEEEAYGSIGSYFHVVIQIQKKQFYDKLLSPFIYAMSFLDNAGMLLHHGSQYKYLIRMLDAIIRFRKTLDITCSEQQCDQKSQNCKLCLEGCRGDIVKKIKETLTLNDINIDCLGLPTFFDVDYYENLKKIVNKSGNLVHLENTNDTNDKIYYHEVTTGRITTNSFTNVDNKRYKITRIFQNIDLQQCENNLVTKMYETVGKLMELLKNENLDYTPYVPDMNASTTNVKYHLPENYNFFTNLQSDYSDLSQGVEEV